MLVEELIALLQKGNPKAEVVRKDHFGVPLEFHQSDFWFSGHPNHKYNDPKNCVFLEIHPPDIGPEPE
jgi:hypothetical protein